MKSLDPKEKSEHISEMIKFRALPDILDLIFNEVPQELRQLYEDNESLLED